MKKQLMILGIMTLCSISTESIAATNYCTFQAGVGQLMNGTIFYAKLIDQVTNTTLATLGPLGNSSQLQTNINNCPSDNVYVQYVIQSNGQSIPTNTVFLPGNGYTVTSILSEDQNRIIAQLKVN